MWNPEIANSIQTFEGHKHSVYSAIWSPREPNRLASCSGDHSVCLWDTGMPGIAHSFIAHEGEVLTLDWDKYSENVLVTGSVDKAIKVFS